MNHTKNQTRILLAFFTLIAFSMPSQVKAMEMNEVQKSATDAVTNTFKPWHQRVAEAVTKRLNAASEYVKNKIHDVTKAPRKNLVDADGNVVIDGQGREIFDSNWISKDAEDLTRNGVQTKAIKDLQDNGQFLVESARFFREHILAVAHRLDIQNASVADLAELNLSNLAIILPELTPKQLSDMVQTEGYGGFPGNFISKLSPDQLIAVLKARPAMFGSEVLSANVTRAQARAILHDSDVMQKLDLDADAQEALETKAKSVFQRALDALKPKKAAPRSVASVSAFDESTPQSNIQTGTAVAENNSSGPIYQGVVKQVSAAKAP